MRTYLIKKCFVMLFPFFKTKSSTKSEDIFLHTYTRVHSSS